jgi:uncharacterized protein (TIGR01244 family)
MNLKFLPFFALLGVAACSFADESRTDAIVAIKAGELKANASLLEGGRTISTGQPDSELLSLAKDAGYTTVVDLRRTTEDRGMDEAAEVAALGMQYIALPVDGANGVTYENAAALDKILAAAEGPVLLHCASGNRVGALHALSRKVAGASNEDALAAGLAAGLTRLEPVVVERLQEK